MTRPSPDRLPRLVATDLDGTLLHSDGHVTERTRRVLATLDEAGVPVVFVTGRPIRWMEQLWAEVGGHGLAVCSNGAITYDVPGRRPLQTWPIDREAGLAVADRVRVDFPGTVFALETPDGFAKEDDFLPHPDDADRPELMVGPLDRVWDPQTVKLLALNLEADPESFWLDVAQAAGDRVTATWSSRAALVEMSAPGVTKAATLQRLAADLGVEADDVVAFGDMPNDVAMLGWAGHSYAMGNAHPRVRDCASRVAPTNDEDGVAAVLEGLFGL